MSDRVEIDLSDIEGIPADVSERLQAMDTDAYSDRRAHFLPWQDSVLLKMWDVVASKDELARTIGFARSTCLKRYRELKRLSG